VTKVTVKNWNHFLRYAQKTQDAPQLLLSNHPSKLMPSRLGARIHVSKASAHLLAINFTSTDHKTLQINQEKKAGSFNNWIVFSFSVGIFLGGFTGYLIYRKFRDKDE
jgi:hypothetical protein